MTSQLWLVQKFRATTTIMSPLLVIMACTGATALAPVDRDASVKYQHLSAGMRPEPGETFYVNGIVYS